MCGISAPHSSDKKGRHACGIDAKVIRFSCQRPDVPDRDDVLFHRLFDQREEVVQLGFRNADDDPAIWAPIQVMLVPRCTLRNASQKPSKVQIITANATTSSRKSLVSEMAMAGSSK